MGRGGGGSGVAYRWERSERGRDASERWRWRVENAEGAGDCARESGSGMRADGERTRRACMKPAISSCVKPASAREEDQEDGKPAYLRGEQDQREECTRETDGDGAGRRNAADVLLVDVHVVLQ